jgi:hypothetical protein
LRGATTEGGFSNPPIMADRNVRPPRGKRNTRVSVCAKTVIKLAALPSMPSGASNCIANKNVALASFRKHMREQDPRRLETLHKNYIVDALPMEEVIQAAK